MNEVCTPTAPRPASAAADALRAGAARQGITVTGLPDDLGWDGAMAICDEVRRAHLGVVAPEIAEALNRGDNRGAAAAFLAQYCPE